MIAQCSHSTLQSLHNAITPHLHPAAAHHRTLYPLRSPPPNPAHSVITPPRIPSCALAVLPRGKRKPSTVHTSSHRCATSFSALAAAPPMPYRSQFITATDDPLLHPPTRNAAKPPTPCNTASCPATTQRHTNHTTARARLTPPVNQKPRSRSCPSCAHPPDLLPHRSHFITPPPSPYPPGRLLAPPPPAPSIPHHHPVPAAFLLRALPLTPPVNRHTRRLPPRLCASWPATAQHQPATPTTTRARYRIVVSSSHPLQHFLPISCCARLHPAPLLLSLPLPYPGVNHHPGAHPARCIVPVHPTSHQPSAATGSRGAPAVTRLNVPASSSPLLHARLTRRVNHQTAPLPPSSPAPAAVSFRFIPPSALAGSAASTNHLTRPNVPTPFLSLTPPVNRQTRRLPPHLCYPPTIRQQGGSTRNAAKPPTPCSPSSPFLLRARSSYPGVNQKPALASSTVPAASFLSYPAGRPNAAKPPHCTLRFLACDHPTAHQPHHRPRSPAVSFTPHPTPRLYPAAEHHHPP